MSVNLQASDNKTGELTKSEKSELVQKATQLLLSKERKGWGEKEKKKDHFQTLANRFGISHRTITNAYYKSVMPIIEEEREKKEKRNGKLHIVKNENVIKSEKTSSLTMKKNEEEEEKLNNDVKNDKTDDKKTVKVEQSNKVNTYEKKVQLDSLGRPLKPPYKPYDIIEVKVDHIRDFGVFCYTMDEYEFKGLLHISEIKDIFVSDANDYFEVGDIIRVKVLLSQPNRLTFSTRDLKVQPKKKKEETSVTDTLPKNPPINVIGEQFGKQLQSKVTSYQMNKPKEAFKEEVDDILKEDEANINKAEIEALFAEQIKEEEERQKAELKKQEEAKKEEMAKTEDGELLPSRINDRDFADVQSYLNSKIGALSPNAQSRLLQILEKQGMFKSSMAISKVADNFVVDYGLIFMEMVARELEKDECL